MAQAQQTPQDLDWSADYVTIIDPDSKTDLTTPEDWEQALEFDEGALQRIFQNDTALYHDTIHGFDVGYEFRYTLSDDGHITAEGTCYAAHITDWSYTTHYDNVVAKATVTVKPRDPRAKALVAQRIAQKT